MAWNVVSFPETAIIVKFKIKQGSVISNGTLLCEYQLPSDGDCKLLKFKSNCYGTVRELLVKEGETVEAGSTLLHVEQCRHLTVWRNMCAECGQDLREEKALKASVAMEHMIPDLLISENRAQNLGQEDESRLLKHRQLVLLVDLDQTLIHTTNDSIPANLKDVYHFQLWPHPAWYHTKFRPHLKRFLDNVCQLYELHICTFGTRTYAHTIAKFLDPDGRYFQQRILSRDECFHPTLKTSNLKALFPRGDSMVCIIDDREDVWKMANNLVHVRPYRFFVGTADINAPPEASKAGEEPLIDEASGNVNKKVKRIAKVVRVPKKSSSSTADEQANLKKSQVCESSINAVSSAAVEDVEGVLKTGSGSVVSESSVCPKEPNESIDETPSADNLEVEDGKQYTNVLDHDQEGSGQVLLNSNTEVSVVVGVDSTEPQNAAGGNGDQGLKADEYEEMIEWEDPDDYLIYLEEILTRIHSVYYKFYDEMMQSDNDKAVIPDLKTVVPYVRHKVLKGAYIVFSGVCPLDTDPSKSKIYRAAKSLGAVVQASVVVSGSEDASPPTTHLVAARLGTQKVKMAMRNKSICVVNPDWLWTCADRWEWVDERLFPLNDEASSHFLSRDSPEPTTALKKKAAGTTSNGLDKDNLSTEDGPSYINETVQWNEKNNSSDLLSSNLLYGFSKEDISGMDAEVKELMDEMDSDDEDDLDTEEKSNSEYPSELQDSSEKVATEEDVALRKQVLSNYGKKRQNYEESSDEDADSLCADFPKGWKPNKRQKHDTEVNVGDHDEIGEDENDGKSSDESDSLSRSDDDDFNESVGSCDDELAAAVEREFLS